MSSSPDERERMGTQGRADYERQIRLIAYFLWEEEGRPEGRHLAHWYRAEELWRQGQESDFPPFGAIPMARKREQGGPKEEAPPEAKGQQRRRGKSRGSTPQRRGEKPAPP